MDTTPLTSYLPVAPPLDAKGRAPKVRHRKLTHAQKAAVRLGVMPSLRAIFTDPFLYEVAARIPVVCRDKGGRKAQYPAWVYLGMTAAVSVLGSKSATVIELRDPDMWRNVCQWAKHTAEQYDIDIPHTRGDAHGQLRAFNQGPSRSQYHYFQASRLTPEVLEPLEDFSAYLYVQRLQQFHIATPDGHRFNHLTRSRCLVVDGKVTNSPRRTLKTETVNKITGEIRTIRVDQARGRYGEGGDENKLVWGSKWGTVVIADTLTNLRITLATEYMPHGEGHSEADTFTNLLRKHVTKFNGGVDAVLIDGAVQGNAIDTIQTELGILVIAPPRRASARRKNAVSMPHNPGERYEAAVVPYDAKHPARGWACGGPVLIAGGGTLWTQQRLDNGTLNYTPVKRGQIKRQTYTHADGTTTYGFTIQLTIETCPDCGQKHTWWESLTGKKSDRGAKFNRAQYLRAATPADPDEWKRVYGMRGDVESNNALIEVAWHGDRMPAWGVHNQSIVMLGWTLYSAAKANATYLKYLNDQAPPLAA